MNEFRMGTIGSGAIVHSILNYVQKEARGIRLYAVYSRTMDRGRSLAEKYGAEKVYTNLEAFLEDADIDLIYIASPNLLHYEQTKRALLAGKHVICEKPFCPRADQAKELITLAKERHLFLVEAVPTTFLPNYPIVTDSLKKLRKVKLVLANYSKLSSRYSQLLAGELPNIFNPQFAGGCLMDINYYNVYLTVALFGKPQTAAYSPNLYRGIDTSGVVHMQYDGFVAECAAAKDTWGVNFYQVEGENGFLYIRDGSNGIAEVRIVTGDSDRTIDLQPVPDRRYYEVKELDALLQAGDHKSLEARLNITLAAVETVEAVRKAAGIVFPGDKE
ncbi:MAG TPA: Gfo/Idh/MocA family oxidoreductase [Candidatus Eisenbergiella merdipullorum]|uniref:Gfo/Idh/MocA family oxidoreductase n=1 Tax=Candidatus Eisenbergiella merdipullorum TaxID=2838553 RepID=A0A9D2KYK4_9FIRM|nr:Gfo/Idh/MocA family oxidoreductase [Candidatus Eisenbergiella merdipullorum]